MFTSNQLSNTFLGYLNLDMSNPSYPPFPDLDDNITPPSPSVSYTLPMMPTSISSRLASPPTPILAPQTVPDPPSPPFSSPIVLSFIRGRKGGQQACYDGYIYTFDPESLMGPSTGNAATKSNTLLPAPAASIHWEKNRRKGRLITTIPLWQNIDPERPQRPRWRSREETIKRLVETYNSADKVGTMRAVGLKFNPL